MNFLRQIDSHRAIKYFYIPDSERTQTYLLDGESSVTQETILNYLRTLTVAKKASSHTSDHRFVVEKLRASDEVFYHLNTLDTQLFSKMFSVFVGTPNWNIGFINNPSSDRRTYLEISADRGEKFQRELILHVESLFKNFLIDQSRMKVKVEKHEVDSDFMDIS